MSDQFIRIYYVEMPSNLKGKWFYDRSDAIFFAQLLYNTKHISMNHPPLWEHIIDLNATALVLIPIGIFLWIFLSTFIYKTIKDYLNQRSD